MDLWKERKENESEEIENFPSVYYGKSGEFCAREMNETLVDGKARENQRN